MRKQDNVKEHKVVYYTVYLSKTDEIVTSGTAKECAHQLGKSINCFYSMVSKNTLGIHNKYSFVKEKVSVDELGAVIDDNDLA